MQVREGNRGKKESAGEDSVDAEGAAAEVTSIQDLDLMGELAKLDMEVCIYNPYGGISVAELPKLDMEVCIYSPYGGVSVVLLCVCFIYKRWTRVFLKGCDAYAITGKYTCCT